MLVFTVATVASILSSLAGKFTVDGTDVEVFVPGKANVSNAIAAWAICKEFGVTIDQFAVEI